MEDLFLPNALQNYYPGLEADVACTLVSTGDNIGVFALTYQLMPWSRGRRCMYLVSTGDNIGVFALTYQQNHEKNI